MSEGLLALLPLLAAWVAMVDEGVGRSPWPLLALTTAQSGVLIWRRRFPLAVLVVVSGLEVTLVALNQEVLVGVVVAAAALGAWGRRIQQGIGLALGLGLLAFGMAVSVGGGTRPADAALAITAVAVMFTGFWLVGRAGARQRGRITALTAYSRRLAAERELAAQRAAADERALLARELHDILNHSVTAMVLDADATAETGDDAETRAALRRLATTGRDSLAELRRLLGVLRKTSAVGAHDPLVLPRRLDQLDELVRAMPDGARVTVARHGAARPLDASVEQAAYRVVQESLTNVLKHAGPVAVVVSLAYTTDRLTVRVWNAPPAAGRPPLRGSGLGLVGMRERVELVGGSLRAGPGGDGGFEVRAILPVRSAA
ncbi:histidine kinase [Actinomycetes bacterium KLBMP 9797]